MKNSWIHLTTCLGLLLSLIWNVHAQEHPQLIIRSDDMGFSHGSNVANQRLLETGMPVNISVLFTGPWYREAVDILKQYDNVSIGVHLCANSEWKNFKWGPVTSKNQVPSLINEEGYFWGSYQELNIDHAPNVDEMEIEFRAQIDRALASGLEIDYIDNHMGAGMHTPEQRKMVESIARDYGLAISSYWGEHRPSKGFSRGNKQAQEKKLYEVINSLESGSLYLLVFHLGTDGPEMRAMQDLNAEGVRNMSEQRQWEMEMLTNTDFRKLIKKNQIELVTYKYLVETYGLDHQKDKD